MHSDDLVGDARAPWHVRPDLRDERGPLRRRVRLRGRNTGKDHARHRQAGRAIMTIMDDKMVPTTPVPEKRTYGGFLKNNVREYGMLLSLVAIMGFFQYMTDGTLLRPLNLTNLVLQNSYIVIMALGMLLVIVAGHIDLSVGSVSGFIGALAAVLRVDYNWIF